MEVEDEPFEYVVKCPGCREQISGALPRLPAKAKNRCSLCGRPIWVQAWYDEEREIFRVVISDRTDPGG